MYLPKILFAIASLVLLSPGLANDPPDLISYQGVLNDNFGVPLDGNFAMTFFFFDSVSDGNEILVDSHASVSVSGGLYSVELGAGAVTDGSSPGIFTSLSAVFAEHSSLYLEVEVQGEILSPRIHLVAVGYALNARLVRGLELVSGGPLDLWVDGSGSGCGGSGCNDLNDGLNLVTAKQTIQAAVNALPIVLKGLATIHISDGTYTGSVLIDRRINWNQEGGGIVLLGNEDFPENVVLDGGSVFEDGITVFGFAEIRGIEIRNFLDSGIEFGYGFTAVDKCRVLNNGIGFEIGQSPGEIGDVLVSGNEEGLVVSNSEELIINGGKFNNNDTFGLSIATGSHVYIEDAQVNNNGADGIIVRSGTLTFESETGSLVVTGNQLTGVVAQDAGVVDFTDSENLTIQGNVIRSLLSIYHSTIRGYENGTVDGAPACTEAFFSICEP